MREYTDHNGIVWTIAPWPDKSGSGEGPQGHGVMPSKGLMFQSSIGWFVANLPDAHPFDLSESEVQERIDRHGSKSAEGKRSSEG